MAARKTTGLESEIARLYALTPAEFTAARKRLAARLRQAGQGAGAERVDELERPTASVWAINLLLRRERERVSALLAAGERARATQQRLLSGKADAEALQASAREVRGRQAQGDLLVGRRRGACEGAGRRSGGGPAGGRAHHGAHRDRSRSDGPRPGGGRGGRRRLAGA